MTGDIIKKEEMVYGKLSDLEMASKVRMLFRDTLEHETVCCGARDRIMYLSQQVERLTEALNRISEPVWWMQEDQLKATGSINGLDGAAAISLASDPVFLKGIAKKALAESV